MTPRRAWTVSITISVILVALGRALLAADLFAGAVILLPGGIVEMIRVGGVHGSSHSKFFTDLCTVGVSLGVWCVVVRVAIEAFDAIKDFTRRKR
ncbi:MAG: hypothetical protein QG602_281 [Verrucomicrobiota bacterium]|nr:hypothetical protein [Verrucomicrobiota bacterium]